MVTVRPPGARTIDEILASARARLVRLTPRQAFRELSGDGVLVDIRPAAQRAAQGEIPRSTIVERNHLEWRLDPCSDARLPWVTGYDHRIIVFCVDGYTSSLAAAVSLLRYIDDNSDGFRILVRDSNPGSGTGTYGTLLSDIAGQVEYILADFLASRGHDPKLAPLYAQMLVGMVAFTGQWWLDARKPKLEEVAANLIDLAWNGLSQLDANGRGRRVEKGEKGSAGR